MKQEKHKALQKELADAARAIIDNAPAHITREYDKFEQIHVYQHEYLTEQCEYPHHVLAKCQHVLMDSDDMFSVVFTLRLCVFSTNNLHLGRSKLILLADKHRIVLQPASSLFQSGHNFVNDRFSYDPDGSGKLVARVCEQATYPLSADDMNKIFFASSVEASLRLPGQSIEFDFTNVMLALGRASYDCLVQTTRENDVEKIVAQDTDLVRCLSGSDT